MIKLAILLLFLLLVHGWVVYFTRQWICFNCLAANLY